MHLSDDSAGILSKMPTAASGNVKKIVMHRSGCVADNKRIAGAHAIATTSRTGGVLRRLTAGYQTLVQAAVQAANKRLPAIMDRTGLRIGAVTEKMELTRNAGTCD